MPPLNQPDHTLQAAYGQLAGRFSAAFPETLPGARTVGREGEYPVVSATGEAVDGRRLWHVLMEQDDLTPEFGPGRPGDRDFIVGLVGEKYNYALEVGLGTIEINTRPCRHLFEVRSLMEEAVGRLVSAAARFNWRVLGYGIQPASPPNIGLMTPKQRYLSLYRAMGAPWLWYTVTAADQLQMAICRHEMVSMLNFGNLMTPVIIALCANSPVYAGKLSPFCSAREGVMADIRADEHRHGMLVCPFDNLVDFVASLSQSTYLIVREDGTINPSSRPFYEYLREHGPDFNAFLFHEHYIWNSARLRAAFGTLEVRPGCQQPWNEHMAAAALTLGLVEAAPAVSAYVQEALGGDHWARMRLYHQQAIRHGLAAPQPAPQFLLRLAEMAEAGLAARGFAEEELLGPIFARLDRAMNPAQRSRVLFASDGLSGLLAHATIRPGSVDRNLQSR